jgi:hypothetical protein
MLADGGGGRHAGDKALQERASIDAREDWRWPDGLDKVALVFGAA